MRSGDALAMPGSSARPSSDFLTAQYSMYIGTTFMPTKTKRPATARIMMNPSSVIPRCVRFMLSPSPRCCVWTCLRDLRADPREIHAARIRIPVEPDQEGLAAEVLLRKEVHRPESAVFRIITIVAHDEILPGRHLPFAIPLHAERIILVFQDGVRTAGERLLQQVRARGLHALPLADILAHRAGPERDAVHVDDVVPVRDGVARQADDAFDPVLVGVVRRAEDHHVAALGFADGQELLVGDG